MDTIATFFEMFILVKLKDNKFCHNLTDNVRLAQT